MTRTTGWLATALLCAAVAGAARAQDDPRATPVFNARHDITAVLTAAKTAGKALVLVLEGDVRYTGKVKDVGEGAVILTGLQGKEFFDAWIPLGAIVAMEERVRLR